MSINIGIHDIKKIIIEESSLFQHQCGEPTSYITDIRVYDINNNESVITLYASDKSKPINIKREDKRWEK